MPPPGRAPIPLPMKGVLQVDLMTWFQDQRWLSRVIGSGETYGRGLVEEGLDAGAAAESARGLRDLHADI